jgi:TolA-binding protein
MRPRSGICLLLFLIALPLGSTPAQGPGGADEPKNNADLELVEQLLLARKNYQAALEKLYKHYGQVGDEERKKWAEEELLQYHRTPKQAFRLDLEVPPATLKGTTNIPAANKLYTKALSYKGKGWKTDFVDNQRRAEILFSQLLAQYPQSNRISDTAYQLGDIYENYPYKQFKRAALYFERCFQWNPSTHHDARLRAAHIYDRNLLNREKAMQIYKEIMNYETDPVRLEEAKRRMQELSGQK